MIIRILTYVPLLLYFLIRKILFIKSVRNIDKSNASALFQETTKYPGRINFMTCMNYIQQDKGKYILCREIDIDNGVYDTNPIGYYHFEKLVQLMEVMRKVEITEDISDDKYLHLIEYIVKNNHKYIGMKDDVEMDFLSSPDNIELYLRLLDVAKLSYTRKLRNKLKIIYGPYLCLK